MEPRVCLAQRALELAAEDHLAAAAVCAAIEQERWRSECLFRAAERRVRSQWRDRYAGALELCAVSDPATAPATSPSGWPRP